MKLVLFIVILVASWFIGLYGWAQIIGSIQNAKSRGTQMTLLTILIWGAIIIGSFFLVWHFSSNNVIAWVIGIVFALVQTLRAGKIE